MNIDLGNTLQPKLPPSCWSFNPWVYEGFHTIIVFNNLLQTKQSKVFKVLSHCKSIYNGKVAISWKLYLNNI
jgi:hypothetical protein